jgi:hypothetical protein
MINKPECFTAAEYLMVQHHAQLGANLIETLDLNPKIPLIVRHHHFFDPHLLEIFFQSTRREETGTKTFFIYALGVI